MNSFTQVGGTLLSANGSAVLGHVNLVWVAGVPGTFECQPEVPVEKGMTYALGMGGYVIVAAKNHDVPQGEAARLFPRQTCKECGKAARARCFNGFGTYWVECEGGHHYSTV